MSELNDKIIYKIMGILIISISYVMGLTWNTAVQKFLKDFVTTKNRWIHPILVTLIGVGITLYLETMRIKIKKKHEDTAEEVFFE
ncbi:hypothetical protein CPAV1605_1523 [seawater metagenome]|uniref:Uncharacterized protein n=1 Tax=seawater metagenome TaxID=1561972 RepID=A0A5E8CKW4_9ZZZZ